MGALARPSTIALVALKFLFDHPVGAGELLLRGRSSSSLHECLDLVQGEAAIFVRVHCLEDPLVSRLKLLQSDGPVTITVHQTKSIRIIMPECILPGPIIPPRPIMPGPPIVPPGQS